MIASKWIFELMLLIYSISLIGYFIDFFKSNNRLNRLSFYLLFIVWGMQTVFLFNQTFIDKHFPILTLNDGLFFYAWILLSFSVLLHYIFNVHFLVFFINLFSFFLLLLSLSLNAQTISFEQGSEFVHEILVIHVTLTLISYGFFTISFTLALMYLVQYHFLKRKKGLRWMWRFADLEWLDAYSFYAVVIGVPLLLIGLVFGLAWAYVSPAEFYWFDIKTIGSILVLFVYIVYLLLRMLKGYRGKPISIYNSAAFLWLLVNFFLFSTLSDFHF